MQLPRRRNLEFDESRYYEYPEHLRPTIDGLPQAPGVYTFHGQEGDLPLYIGKSVNLRARVLSHLRNPEEARLLRQTTRITYIRTAGEIGALLLEAQMIKQQHPLMNQKLRRNRQLCAIRLDDDGRPEVVYARDVDFASERGLYGLYGSRHAALDALRALADDHHLCHGALGLEQLSKGRGCFRSMLKKCAGVCCGRENPAEHQARLMGALEDLQLVCWPFGGAVALVERFQDKAEDLPVFEQWHVVRNWCYLGSAYGLEQAKSLDRLATGFDADGYKILCKPLMAVAAGVPGTQVVHL